MDKLFDELYYNIPSNNRELQRLPCFYLFLSNYNIPSNNRELQRSCVGFKKGGYYNIPSNNRELQLSQRYQEQ